MMQSAHGRGSSAPLGPSAPAAGLGLGQEAGGVEEVNELIAGGPA